jgi:alkyl hydroperoxide reductase subunit D
VVREKGATDDLVIAIVRVSAVIHAIGTVIDAVQTQSAASSQEREPETVVA